MSVYKITKVTTRNYYVTYVRQFMDYKTFSSVRSSPSTCFCCGKRFKDGDMLYLGAVETESNKVFCEECGKKIIKYLEDDDTRRIEQ